jgi:hypothetical protein
MKFLNEEIAFLTKRIKTESLVKPENSCGIFQDYGEREAETGWESDRKEV